MLLFNIESDMVVFLIYMDDIVVIEKNTSLVQSMINMFNEVFIMKDLGNLNFFLGIEVIRISEMFHLCQ